MVSPPGSGAKGTYWSTFPPVAPLLTVPSVDGGYVLLTVSPFSVAPAPGVPGPLSGALKSP